MHHPAADQELDYQYPKAHVRYATGPKQWHTKQAYIDISQNSRSAIESSEVCKTWRVLYMADTCVTFDLKAASFVLRSSEQMRAAKEQHATPEQRKA